MNFSDDIKTLKKLINYDDYMNSKKIIDNELNISTMTVCCNFINTEIKCSRISKLLPLGVNCVVACGSSTLLKTKKKKIIKKKYSFLNQISLKIVVPDKNPNNPINVKLFKNGSVQMTGCITIKDSIDALVRICNILTTKLFNKKKNIKQRLCTGKDLINSITKYQIGMINSNFDIGFWIDRNRLLEILKTKKLDVTFDSNSHASVKIKYPIDDIVITILVFEKGKIIITGSRNYNHLKIAYDYINKLLLSNYFDIFKVSNNIVYEIAKNWIS
jgi:TATA-box binding protein (TBP) (component of TFIID and TFIIIB)